MTKYEREIYRLINESTAHMTAEQVYDELRRSYPGVSLATVYNNLRRLTDEGLIRRISLDGSPDRYDRSVRHDHIVCANCGRIADMSFADLSAALRGQLGEDFLYYDLKVYYLCPECRAERKKV